MSRYKLMRPCYFDETLGVKIHCFEVDLYADACKCQCGEQTVDRRPENMFVRSKYAKMFRGQGSKEASYEIPENP